VKSRSTSEAYAASASLSGGGSIVKARLNLSRYRPVGVDFWAVLQLLLGQFDRKIVFFSE
jgi:hypothetical protein